MGIDEFFEKLPRDGWKLDGRYIVRKRRLHWRNVCPISCLVKPMRPSNEWDFAAKDLGLPDELAKDIVDAADNNPTLRYKERILPLRARLLAHCGLQEPRQ